jgi:catechol 2,3-dioxygenase-like lactoylglutathione lyase family enzyme
MSSGESSQELNMEIFSTTHPGGIYEDSITHGFVCLRVTSAGPHMKFLVETLGGAATQAAGSPVVDFPGMRIFMDEQPPTGGTKGTILNHLGFQVPDAHATIERIRRAGYPIVTREEIPAKFQVQEDVWFHPDQKTHIAFTMGPDGAKVEIVENKAATAPIAFHHFHFFTPEVDAMKAWYVETFLARPGRRGSIETADLPGVNLSFSQSAGPVAGTEGRTMDRIGFGVRDFEGICGALEARGLQLTRQPRVAEQIGSGPVSEQGVAFLVDPWGTRIELTGAPAK